MSNPQILRDILNIDVNNEFLKYITERVKQEDYRGNHFSQHNRYDFNILLAILKIIENVAGFNRFKLHPGDDKGTRYSYCSEYYEIVDKVNNKIGKGTINSVKKTLFVDFGRMGFLDRFNEKGVLISGKGRAIVDSAKIGKLGEKLLKSNAITKQHEIFMQGLAKLFEDYINNLAETIYHSNFKNEKIDIFEFMFILSDGKNRISNDRKIELLTSYRKLSEDERKKLKILLQEYCEPTKFAGNKTVQKDFGNWKNECQQNFKLLGYTVYFDVKGEYIYLSPEIIKIFDGP